MKKFFICILFVSIASQHFGYAVKNELCERIYLQTDKQIYLAGESVRMKLLTIDSDLIPLVFSKVAYVELVDDSLSRYQIKVELINGIGEGLMLLPANLPTGYYRLIAYTQYMRNEGVDVFFKKDIGIVNTFQSGDYPIDEEQEEQLTFQDISTSGNISLQLDKVTYTTRDRGELILKGLPRNIYSLSVSIAGKELAPATEPDLLLLRKTGVKKSTEFTGKFLPEYEGHIITGKIVDNQTGNVALENISYNTGLSFPGDGIRYFTGQQNETKDIRFITSGISEMSEVATIIFDTDDKYRIDIQSPFVSQFDPESMQVLHIDSANYSKLLARSVSLQVLHYFSDDSIDNQIISEPFIKIKPTYSYKLDEYTRFTTMREVFTEFIKEGRFRRRNDNWEITIAVKKGDNSISNSVPLVFLDGVPISNHDIIYNYDPLTIERINAYHVPCLFGGLLFDGVVEFKTYNKLHQNLDLNKSTQVIPYEGPQAFRWFHTPDYSVEKNRRSRIPDGRHTLLWNPDIKTNGETSVKLPFDTSDLTGDFQVVVEGITDDGEIVFASTSFKVAK